LIAVALSFRGEQSESPESINTTLKERVRSVSRLLAPLAVMDFHASSAALRVGLAFGVPE
jgi:hypothetical protein